MSPADWLKHATIYKTPWDSFSEDDKKTYLPYIMNLWIANSPQYIELTNMLQSYQVPNKYHYEALLQVLPKKQLWLQWMKPKNKQYSKELLIYLSDFYKLSTKEIEEYIFLLDDEKIVNILENMGLDKKEIKKILHG